MAKQNVTTNDQQSQGTAMARGSERDAMQRRRSDPRGLPLSPIDFFFMNPFSVMRRMTEEMDRAFAEVSSSNGGAAVWAPAIEVSQKDGQYAVRAELPGLKPEEVKVEVMDDALVLEGERKFEHEEDKGGMHRTEMRYGRFYRSIPLPEGAKVDQARAKFDNGVLEITVPVQEAQSNRKQIQVEGASATSSAGPGKAGAAGSTESAGKAA
jgi:HSP20 family protein